MSMLGKYFEIQQILTKKSFYCNIFSSQYCVSNFLCVTRVQKSLLLCWRPCVCVCLRFCLLRWFNCFFPYVKQKQRMLLCVHACLFWKYCCSYFVGRSLQQSFTSIQVSQFFEIFVTSIFTNSRTWTKLSELS